MKNFIFLISLLFVFVFSTAAVLKCGPYEFARFHQQTKERLRDFTFQVWDENLPTKHGFLVFLENDKSLSKNYAYGSHGYGFLFIAYCLYKIEKTYYQIPMRISIVIISLVLSFILFAKIILKNINKHNKNIFLALAPLIAAFAFSPDLWWTAIFNVDNCYIIFMPLYFIFLFHFLQNEKAYYFYGLLLPLTSPILSLFSIIPLLLQKFLTKKNINSYFLIGIALLGLVLYAIPLLIIKNLKLNSAASSFLFRTGWDGDRKYFKNQIQAIFDPWIERPHNLVILVTVSLLFLSYLYLKNESNNKKLFVGDIKSTFLPFFGIYVFFVAIFPQGVSIHPYLFDFCFIFPVWVLLFLVQLKIININSKTGVVLCATNTTLLVINLNYINNIFGQSIAKKIIPFGSI